MLSGKRPEFSKLPAVAFPATPRWSVSFQPLTFHTSSTSAEVMHGFLSCQKLATLRPLRLVDPSCLSQSLSRFCTVNHSPGYEAQMCLAGKQLSSAEGQQMWHDFPAVLVEYSDSP